MHDFLTQHQFGIIVFLTAIILIAISNCLTVHRIRRRDLPGPFPKVSVLVPAKDEERNIETCVKSLLKQDYQNFELLVLEDGSIDGTPEILRRLARDHEELKIIQGEPRPEAWIGKHWACHQLSQRATGEVFLFTDADTTHQSNSVGDAVSTLIAKDIDLLTALPQHDIRSIGEKVLVPPLVWAIMTFSPFALAYVIKLPALATANGQFMMFRRDAYKAVGGHEAVRENVVDDIALAKRIVAARLKWRFLDGRDQFSCRMYRSFGEAWRGFTKNLFAVFDYNIPFTIFVWIWLPIVFLEPLVVLILWAAGAHIAPLGWRPAAVAAAEALALWLLIYARFGIPAYLALLYPFKIVFYAVLSFNSMYANLKGKAEWKGQKFRGRRSPVR
jgi:chlorobactene glucosyltransferase